MYRIYVPLGIPLRNRNFHFALTGPLQYAPNRHRLILPVAIFLQEPFSSLQAPQFVLVGEFKITAPILAISALRAVEFVSN